MAHKHEDYKMSAVKYYLKNDVSMDDVCDIFDCGKTSLKRWIDRYETKKEIKRQNRKAVSYKITEKQVKYALELLKKNEQITMIELAKLIKKKYKDFELNIVDGAHRLSKAYLLNKKHIRAYIFNKDIMEKFKIGEKKKQRTWKKSDWNYYESLTKKNVEELYTKRFT